MTYFEESQFENNRADNWKKFKQTAVPTISNVPNPPKSLDSKRKKGLGLPKKDINFHNYATISAKETVENEKSSASHLKGAETVPSKIDTTSDRADDITVAALHQEILALKRENESLKTKFKVEQHKTMLEFLSAEQFEIAKIERHSISGWSNEGIIKGLKLCLALGNHGYNYLRSTGYPTTHYSTLSRRISGIDLNYGVIESLKTPLKTKVEVMDSNDRECCMSVNEMELSTDNDTVSSSFTGHVTLGSKESIGNHYTVVLLRGLKNSWKQVIAHEIIGPSTTGLEMKKLISGAITAVGGISLNVRALVLHMGKEQQSNVELSGGLCQQKH